MAAIVLDREKIEIGKLRFGMDQVNELGDSSAGETGQGEMKL